MRHDTCCRVLALDLNRMPLRLVCVAGFDMPDDWAWQGQPGGGPASPPPRGPNLPGGGPRNVCRWLLYVRPSGNKRTQSPRRALVALGWA